MTKMKRINLNVLMVEDSSADVLMVKEALQDVKIQNTLHVVGDGIDAIEFLKKKGRFHSSTTPDLILLDLNLPKKNGNEVLIEIKNDENLKCIPVVIFTTSSSSDDMRRSYKSYANSYVIKPVDFNSYQETIHTIFHYWYNVVSIAPLSV